MKYLHAVLIGCLTSTVALAMPTVTEVEANIAKGDYTAAKVQLNEVLKSQPESIVATKYLWEITKIENARDNVASTEYKVYEARVAKLEADKAERIRKAKVLEEQKARAEFWKTVRNVVAWFAFLIIIGVVLCLTGYYLKRRYDKVLAFKAEQAFIESLQADILDIDEACTRLLPHSKSPMESTMLQALKDDNTDLNNLVTSGAYFNHDDAKRHVQNGRKYLRGLGEDL